MGGDRRGLCLVRINNWWAAHLQADRSDSRKPCRTSGRFAKVGLSSSSGRVVSHVEVVVMPASLSSSWRHGNRVEVRFWPPGVALASENVLSCCLEHHKTVVETWSRTISEWLSRGLMGSETKAVTEV